MESDTKFEISRQRKAIIINWFHLIGIRCKMEALLNCLTFVEFSLANAKPSEKRRLENYLPIKKMMKKVKKLQEVFSALGLP